jgi:hypothetical protein
VTKRPGQAATTATFGDERVTNAMKSAAKRPARTPEQQAAAKAAAAKRSAAVKQAMAKAAKKS